jgi:hypothetical protein
MNNQNAARAQHTPTPATLIADQAISSNGMHEIRAGGVNLRDRPLIGYAVSYEYAKRIVRACNAHDDLVATLRAYLEADQTMSPEWQAQARAALAKAGAA